MSEFMPIRKCPVCGKEFIPAAFHVYKIVNPKNGGYRKVCSWGCQRKWEKKHGEKGLKNEN